MPIYSQVLDNGRAERFRRLRELLSRKGRTKSGRFLIEGPQAVREALTWAPGVVLDLYVAVESADEDAPFASPLLGQLAGLALKAASDAGATIYVHKATRAAIDSVSADAQGVFAVASIAAFEERVQGAELSGSPFVAAFWQVRDPGNAGTVIRSADAAGCDAVLFVGDCVDLLNPKVIRATTGSLFHLPVLNLDEEAFAAWRAEHGCTLVAADVHGTDGNAPVQLPAFLESRPDATQGTAVLFGNEARGLEPAMLQDADAVVSIPIYGKAESLNLAMSASIMLMSMAMSSAVETM